MSAGTQIQTTRQPREIEVVRDQLTSLEGQLEAALPAHIPVERFNRVVMTAIQNNMDLLRCDRKSLFNACMKAAQDGLLPDGREGAIVPYKGEATWMPMIGGIRKKVRNSGEISSWDVHAVYENDLFEFELGDDPYIKHRPALSNKGKLIAVYSVAVLKGGEKSRDVMSIEDVEKIRAKSRSKNGPWADPTFYPEMAKKTVARRHSKVLPMSSDLDDLIRRDDALYDLKGASDTEVKGPRLSMTAALDQLAGPSIDRDADDADEADDQPARGHTAEQSQADRVADDRGTVVKDKNPEALGTSGAAGEAAEGEGSGVQPSAASDFPGDKPMGAVPDFEALLAEFERDAPNATTEEELGEIAADLRKAMDEHPPSRAFQTKAANAWQGQIDRINGLGRPAEQKPAGVDTNDPDYRKGWSDAERGGTKCLKSEIRDNPERHAKWKAGFDAYKAQGAEG
jgi:recombination protein RecT